MRNEASRKYSSGHSSGRASSFASLRAVSPALLPRRELPTSSPRRFLDLDLVHFSSNLKRSLSRSCDTWREPLDVSEEEEGKRRTPLLLSRIYTRSDNALINMRDAARRRVIKARFTYIHIYTRVRVLRKRANVYNLVPIPLSVAIARDDGGRVPACARAILQ